MGGPCLPDLPASSCFVARHQTLASSHIASFNASKCNTQAKVSPVSSDNTSRATFAPATLHMDPDDFGECDEYFCGNDPYWRYDAGDKGLLGCDDIAGEPEKIEKRCRTQERIGVDATGREVRASIACKGVCRLSCEGC